jgi:hypothetical protein
MTGGHEPKIGARNRLKRSDIVMIMGSSDR